MAGMKPQDLDLSRRVNKSKATLNHSESLSDAAARLLIKGGCTDELFGTLEIQKASESGNVTDTRDDDWICQPWMTLQMGRFQSMRMVFRIRMVMSVL